MTKLDPKGIHEAARICHQEFGPMVRPDALAEKIVQAYLDAAEVPSWRDQVALTLLPTVRQMLHTEPALQDSKGDHMHALAAIGAYEMADTFIRAGKMDRKALAVETAAATLTAMALEANKGVEIENIDLLAFAVERMTPEEKAASIDLLRASMGGTK